MQTQVPYSPAEVETEEAVSKETSRAFSKAGFRESHSACPPERVAGPYIPEALANGISFETGTNTGKKRLIDIA